MKVRRILPLFGLIAVVAVAASTTIGTAASKATCNNSNPVEFGVLNSVSGPAANIGKLNQQGMDIAIRDVNDAGGVLGRCIKRVLRDDGGDPTKAAQGVRELVDQEGVKFLIGPFLSSPTSVVMPVANQAKVLNINESAFPGADNPQSFPYVFARETPSTMIAQLFANFIKANGWKRVGVIAVNNALGQILVPALNQVIPPAGATITKVELVPAGTPDLTPQMSTIKATNPDVVIMGLTDDPGMTAVIKAKIQLNMSSPLLGYSSAANPGTVNNFSKSQIKELYAAQIYKAITYTSPLPGKGAPTWKPARVFIAKYAKYLKANNIKQSVLQASGGYDSVRILAWAINGATSTDTDKVKDFMETHKYIGVRGAYIWSKASHGGVARIPLYTVVYGNSLNNYGALRQVVVKK